MPHYTFSRRTFVIAVVAVALLVVGLFYFISRGSSTPSSTGPGNLITPTTKYIPPITSNPAAAAQVAKNEAFFAEQRVASATLQLLGGSHVITQAIVNKAIANTSTSSGPTITATVHSGAVLLRGTLTIAHQTAVACASFSASTLLVSGAQMVACP